MDYRTQPMAAVYSDIARVRSSGKEREQIINDLAKVAVFHSIRDGQVTPAQKLMGALGRTDAAKEVGLYLQKFGNIGFGKLKDGGKGFKYLKKHEHDGQEYADSEYNALPNIWEAFENKPVEMKDYDLHKAILRIAAEARARTAAGKQVICANDAEVAIFESILMQADKIAA